MDAGPSQNLLASEWPLRTLLKNLALLYCCPHKTPGSFSSGSGPFYSQPLYVSQLREDIALKCKQLNAVRDPTSF